MPCPHCHSETSANAYYCQHCGAPLTPIQGRIPGPGSAPPSTGKDKSLIIILAVVIPLVLVVIIGILAAIAIPSFSRYANRARQAADNANIRNVNAAAEIYYQDYGVSPPNLETVVGRIQPRPQWKYYNKFVFEGNTLKAYKE